MMAGCDFAMLARLLTIRRQPPMKQTLLALAGAVVGGVLGYFAFFWIVKQGFYALILPGGLLGLGASFGKPRSIWPAAACGVAALALGIYTEWRYAAFQKDDGFSYFLLHLADLKPITLLMIAAGAALGFWIPFRSIDRRPLQSGRGL